VQLTVSAELLTERISKAEGLPEPGPAGPRANSFSNLPNQRLQLPDSQQVLDSQQSPVQRQGPPASQLQPSSSQGQSSQTHTSQQLQGLEEALRVFPNDANAVGIAKATREHRTENFFTGILRLGNTKWNQITQLCPKRLIPPGTQDCLSSISVGRTCRFSRLGLPGSEQQARGAHLCGKNSGLK
jgi:hypothetical protein